MNVRWVLALNILAAHRKLSEMGIVHRDVSPGNVLLAGRSGSAGPGVAGILHDIEFARIPSTLIKEHVEEISAQEHSYTQPPIHTSQTSRKHLRFNASALAGAPMTVCDLSVLLVNNTKCHCIRVLFCSWRTRLSRP